MKVKILSFILFIFTFFLFYNTSYSANIEEVSPLKFLKFVDYQVVNSVVNGNIITRSIKVIVQNTSENQLSNLSLNIDGLPDYVSMTNTEIFIGTINPGEIITTDSILVMVIDKSQLPDDGLRLIWRVECDSVFDHFMDETAIIDYLYF
jgi:hypothetical protein